MTSSNHSTNSQPLQNASVKKATPTSLGFEWRKYVMSKYGVEVILTAAHLGQLKYFIKSTGDEALVAMYFALENWSKFTLKVGQVVNLTYYPQGPDITFMSQHSKMLLMCMTEKNDPSAPMAKNPAIYHSTALPDSVPEPKSTPEQAQKTFDQLAAVYAGQNKA